MSSAEQVVRPARPADIALLTELMAEFYAESGYPLEAGQAASTFAELLRDPSLGCIWILIADGEPAGYGVLTVGYSLEYGGRDAFLDDLFVRPRFRQRGLGRAALDEVLRECRRRRIRAVHLEVARENHRAKALYRETGFRSTDRELLTLRIPEGTAD